MTVPTTAAVTPPRVAQQLLCAWLPDDAMRDTIVGDLHQELVWDTERMGADRARVRYRQRVAGIVAYVIIDAIRLRRWTTAPIPVAASAAAAPHRAAPRDGRALLGRADMGLIAAAFGVLGVGIVVNTMLFSTVRHVPSVPSAGSVTNSALGVVSLVLALGSAGVAAVMLCVGPRWLRRRVCRQQLERQVNDDAAAARGAVVAPAVVPDPRV